MEHEISCEWKGGMAFEANVMGHSLRLDTDEEGGGKGSGVKPKPLVLTALAGCTGMDVVSILQKMREPLSWFNVRVVGEVADEHPKRYVGTRIIYEFKADDGLNPDNVKKAIELSQEKYCGVSALLQLAIPVDWEVSYI
jgi:putative redox protein